MSRHASSSSKGKQRHVATGHGSARSNGQTIFPGVDRDRLVRNIYGELDAMRSRLDKAMETVKSLQSSDNPAESSTTVTSVESNNFPDQKQRPRKRRRSNQENDDTSGYTETSPRTRVAHCPRGTAGDPCSNQEQNLLLFDSDEDLELPPPPPPIVRKPQRQTSLSASLSAYRSFLQGLIADDKDEASRDCVDLTGLSSDDEPDVQILNHLPSDVAVLDPIRPDPFVSSQKPVRSRSPLLDLPTWTVLETAQESDGEADLESRPSRTEPRKAPTSTPKNSSASASTSAQPTLPCSATSRSHPSRLKDMAIVSSANSQDKPSSSKRGVQSGPMTSKKRVMFANEANMSLSTETDTTRINPSPSSQHGNAGSPSRHIQSPSTFSQSLEDAQYSRSKSKSNPPPLASKQTIPTPSPSPPRPIVPQRRKAEEFDSSRDSSSSSDSDSDNEGGTALEKLVRSLPKHNPPSAPLIPRQIPRYIKYDLESSQLPAYKPVISTTATQDQLVKLRELMATVGFGWNPQDAKYFYKTGLFTAHRLAWDLGRSEVFVPRSRREGIVKSIKHVLSDGRYPSCHELDQLYISLEDVAVVYQHGLPRLSLRPRFHFNMPGHPTPRDLYRPSPPMVQHLQWWIDSLSSSRVYRRRLQILSPARPCEVFVHGIAALGIIAISYNGFWDVYSLRDDVSRNNNTCRIPALAIIVALSHLKADNIRCASLSVKVAGRLFFHGPSNTCSFCADDTCAGNDLCCIIEDLKAELGLDVTLVEAYGDGNAAVMIALGERDLRMRYQGREVVLPECVREQLDRVVL